MKAILLEKVKSPLKRGEIKKPAPSPNQSLIKLSHAGLNRRDYWIQQGKYPGMDLPVVLGSDGLGLRESDGKRVFFNPGLNWGNNQRFQQNEFHLIGMPGQGTMAEYIAVPDHKIYKVPEHLSDEEGASLPLAGVTAYRGLFIQGNLKRNQNVFIAGAGGGVANMAIKFSLAAGANVYTNSSSDEKISTTLEWGCEYGWNYIKSNNWAENAKQHTRGFDLILDGAGGNTITDYIDLLRRGGRLVAYGATLGSWINVPAAKVFYKQIHIIGSTMGSDQDFSDMLEFVNKYKIRPHVDKVFTFGNANDALQYMVNPESFGKIVLKINDQ